MRLKRKINKIKKKEKKTSILTPHEHEKRAWKGVYRSFVLNGKPKIDIGSYFDETKRHIKALTEDQLKQRQSAKIIMTLWVHPFTPVKLAFTVDPEDSEGVEVIPVITTPR